MREAERGKYFIFVILLAGCMVCSFLQTALNTALPAIMGDLGVSMSTAQWLTSAFSLAMGIMIPATAFLIRRFPVRNLLTVSMGSFLAGAILCGTAGSFPVLLAGRILQALACGTMMSLTQVVILTVFPENKRGGIMGIYGLAVMSVPIFAPTLAGFLIDGLGWKSIFWIAAAVAFPVVAAGMGMKKNLLETKKEVFDAVSMVMCGAGFTGILLGLGNMGTYSFWGKWVALPLLLGSLLLVAFVVRQLKLATPFLNVRIFSNREFRWSVILSMMLYAVMMAGSVLLPVYIQSMRGFSATMSGLVMMPGSIATAVVSPIVGRIYDKLGIKKLLRAGTGLLFLSCLGLCGLSLETSLVFISVMFVVRLIAVGCMMMPLVTWGMSTLPAWDTANGTALLTSLRTIAGAISPAVLIAVMTMISGGPNNAEPALQIAGMRWDFIIMAVLAASFLMLAAAATYGRKAGSDN